MQAQSCQNYGSNFIKSVSLQMRPTSGGQRDENERQVLMAFEAGSRVLPIVYVHLQKLIYSPFCPESISWVSVTCNYQ